MKKVKKSTHQKLIIEYAVISITLVISLVVGGLIFAQNNWVDDASLEPSNSASNEITPSPTLEPSPTLNITPTIIPTPTLTLTPTIAPTQVPTPIPTLNMIPHYKGLPDYINSLQETIDFSVNLNNTSDNILVRVSVIDVNSDERAGINEKVRSHPASTIKTIFLLFFLEDVVAGKRDLNEIRVLQESDKWTSTGRVDGTGILKNKEAGSEYTWFDLLSLMMVKSDNVATNIVISELGIENIRQRISSLGLKNTNFLGLIYDAKATSCSAEDLAIVLDELYNRSLNNQIYKDGLDLMKLAEGRLRIALYLEEMEVYHKPGHDFNIYADTGYVFYNEQKDPVIISVFVSTIDRTALTYDYARALIGQVSYDIMEYVKSRD